MKKGTQFWFLFVHGCIEPSLDGPYTSWELMRRRAALMFKKEGTEYHTYLWVSVSADGLDCGTFQEDELEAKRRNVG
jgi:hypothetical protein